jgi:hypothetical protein
MTQLKSGREICRKLYNYRLRVLYLRHTDCNIWQAHVSLVFWELPAFIMVDKWNMFTAATKWWQECVCIFTVPCDYINLSQVIATKGDNRFRLMRELYKNCTRTVQEVVNILKVWIPINMQDVFPKQKNSLEGATNITQNIRMNFKNLINTTSNKSTPVVTFLTCIREVPWSNCGRGTGYGWGFRGIPQCLQA